MKKNVCRLFITIFGVLGLSLLLTSGMLNDALEATLYKNAPNYKRAKDVLAPDLSDYFDYLIKDCVLPDGKVADVYVFNNIQDQIRWQNAQIGFFSSRWRKMREKDIKEAVANGEDTSFYKWWPKGPLTPFYKQWGNLEDKYGEVEANKICIAAAPISYYKPEDLGQLSEYMKTLDCAAQACYEDSDGVYLLTIVKTKWIPQNYIISQKMRSIHKDEFVYEIGFIPKTMYKEESLKLNPAKTQPFVPSSIPDSDNNLKPVKPSGTGTYYYDSAMTTNLQWLAVKIACKGIYDFAYTGDFSLSNPHDYYTTSLIKKYLATEGKHTKGTMLFEGICFDYADFAYQELASRKTEYPNIERFWMVGTFDNPADIHLYKIAAGGEKSNNIINNTPVFEFGHQHIIAHDESTSHAWLWVQSTDGTIYWVDPTHTDNTGRPVYGIVRGGREIQLEPDPRFFAW